MIQASQAYIAANAKLHKEPVFLIVIEGYARAFATKDIGGFYRQNLSLEIPGTAGPWEVTSSLNTAFNYGAVGPGGASYHDWSPPVLYPGFFNTGDALPSLGSPSGTVDSSGALLPPSGFSPIFPAWTYVGGLPFFNAEQSAGTLCGAWVDINGRVVQPVWIAANGFVLKPGGGDGSICPAGASLFQIGINDDVYKDNTGSNFIDLGIVDSDIVDWIVSMEDMTISVNELDGGADHGGFSFTVQDFDGLITADFPTFAFEGKRVTLLMGFVGLATDDFIPIFNGKVDTIVADNVNLEYTFNCIDALQNDLAKNIWRYADDGFETSDGHSRHLVGHPLDLLLSALQNELGMSSTRINVAKIEAMRDGPYNGMWFEFFIKSPPAAKDWIQQELCRPLGAYLWTNYLGQVDINFFYPLSLDPVTAINTDTLILVPLEEQADIVNQVKFQFDFTEADDKAEADTTVLDSDSLKKYGPGPLLTIESRGMRSGFQGFLHAAIIAKLIFLRFAQKNAMFSDGDSMINLWNPGVYLEPGDLVSLTCDLIPDRELGIRGMTEKLFEVCDRTYHWNEMRLEVGFTLLRVQFPAFEQFKIAPANMADYEAAGSGNKATYMFMASDTDTQSGGEDANTLT